MEIRMKLVVTLQNNKPRKYSQKKKEVVISNLNQSVIKDLTCCLGLTDILKIGNRLVRFIIPRGRHCNSL